MILLARGCLSVSLDAVAVKNGEIAFVWFNGHS